MIKLHMDLFKKNLIFHFQREDILKMYIIQYNSL